MPGLPRLRHLLKEGSGDVTSWARHQSSQGGLGLGLGHSLMEEMVKNTPKLSGQSFNHIKRA